MKIFFILNLYSSFKKIINEKKIVEVGNISLIKLIKKISIKDKCTVILLDKNLELTKKEIKFFNIQKINFYILPLKISIGQINLYSVLRCYFFLFKRFFNFNKNTIYTDRGNIFLAYLFKIFSFNKIIIRVLGITKNIELSLEKQNIRGWILRQFWKKKFDLVIHSNDGSNFKNFDNKFLNKKNKKLILNQSVESIKFKKRKIISKKFKILLSDNFESEYKNLAKIIDALKGINTKLKKKILLVIIIPNKKIQKKIKSELISFKNTKFINRVDYTSILNIKNDVDALLSFNSMGYLSNNIVESIFYKNWIITPKFENNHRRIPKSFLRNFVFLNVKNTNKSLNANLNKLIYKKKCNINHFNIYSNDEKVKKEFSYLKRNNFIS